MKDYSGSTFGRIGRLWRTRDRGQQPGFFDSEGAPDAQARSASLTVAPTLAQAATLSAASDYVAIGAGDITTRLPDGKTGLTDSRGDKPVLPALTADYTGAPPTNSIFTPIAYHQFDDFSSGWMNADPMSFKTDAKGLQVSYAATPSVTASDYYYNSYPSLTLGLAGLLASQTRLAGLSDWTATADWDGKMRATLVQGGLFTYVTRQSDDDVTIDLQQAPRSSRDNPVDPLSYVASGLTGTFNGGALGFTIPVDAGQHVADGIQLRVSYDFDGNGKVDRTETYDWFGTDAGNGFETYTASKVVAATGVAMRDMAGGTVKIELWRANGDGDLLVKANDAASAIKLPFAALSSAAGAIDDGTLYLGRGATAAGPASTLDTRPGGAAGLAAGTDTTHATPPPSIGGYTGPGQVWYQQDGVVGLTVNGVSYGIFGPPGATWTYTDSGLRSDLGGQDFYSVAVLPDASAATLQAFRKHAYAFVTGSEAHWSVDKGSNTLTTAFSYTTQMMVEGPNFSADPLTSLYYHQYKNSDAALAGFSYNSPRGKMEAFAGSSFSTRAALAPILPIMPFIGSDEQKTRIQEMLHGELKAFLSQAGNPMEGDTYWGARQVAKYTDLALLAQQAGYGQAKETFLLAAQKQLEKWFTASDGDAFQFYYDDKWRLLIGYPGSYNSDDKANDMSLQFGYMINAAATIAQLDPEWARQEQWGAMVNEVIANVNNWKRDDPKYNYLRAFDPYQGHNWASGTGNGITQESATESLNFDAAVARWGAATGQKDIEDLGNYLYTTEAQAFMYYYLDVDKTVFPEGFDRSRLGILGGSGGAYATYFGMDPNYIQGINQTPMLPQSSLFMGLFPKEIREDFAYLARETGDRSTEWMNSTQMYLALADPEAALADYKANPQYQSGGGQESRVFTLQFIESLVAMGTIDGSIRADSPYASAYSKNGAKSYVAWNPGASATTVTFTDGTRLTVGAGDMLTKAADGGLHTVDFQNDDLAYRPPGIPLDLPTDPPGNPLTLVSRKGDVTLSVEAVTGSAWVTIGDGAPRALLGDNAARIKVQNGNDRLVAAGRDANGAIHLLLATGVNGNEPYYDKTLTDRFRLVDNGAALYNSDYARLEPLYGRDFNGDGIAVGGALRLVSQNGDVKLFVDGGDGRAYVQDGANAMVEVRRHAGGAATLLARQDAALSAVGKDADGAIRVLDTGHGGWIGYSWKLDAKGNWTGENAVRFADDPAAVREAEAIYQRDLDGDGVVPKRLAQVVAKNGALSLLVDADGLALIQLEDGTRINVLRGGQPVTLDRGSRLSAIGRDVAGNLRVLDGSPTDFGPNATHWSWKLDTGGNFVGEDVFAGAEIGKVEGLYGTDFDRDGKIVGARKELIARNGAAALFVEQSTGTAFVSVGAGDAIAVTRDGGWGNVQAQRGAWGLLAVAIDDEGRTRVLDANPFDDTRYAWILDANGHWSGEQVFGKPQTGAAELMFSIDLDHDGVIGGAAARLAVWSGTGGASFS